ncbi:meiotic recombination protein Rec24 [Schizosaccharomyces cryophilus OY26]|uniref:Meiotic recombination protein Rec24 n=1 Tax=Schizosaccharomyces cryophilus (strain OY26 / ATCC MYA-4695 / CBS 11777 / NBRC 106824 / NRRL Y48691) TaxID=653667 RepID=S9W2G0_SCHCR|nr:meiotic recombination protein Rec24 [Schizosaccharomyces cryophilus OY26]EPY52594.1 meiotic recombination protein Rec24 [Schizosaccharomyces cryophilus OY26]
MDNVLEGDETKLAISWSIVRNKPKGESLELYIKRLRQQLQDEKNHELKATLLAEKVLNQEKSKLKLEASCVLETLHLPSKVLQKEIDDIDLYLLSNIYECLQEKRASSEGVSLKTLNYVFDGIFRFLKCSADPQISSAKDYPDEFFAKIKSLFEDILILLKRDLRMLQIATRLADLAQYVLHLIVDTHRIMQTNATQGFPVLSRAKFLDFYKFLEQSIFLKLSSAAPNLLEQLVRQVVSQLETCFLNCKSEDFETRLLYSECFFSFTEIFFPCLHSYDTRISKIANSGVQKLRDLIHQEESHISESSDLEFNFASSYVLLTGLKELLPPNDLFDDT